MSMQTMRARSIYFALSVFYAAFAGAQSLTVSHFAGSATGGGYEDGTGSAARFSGPVGVVTDTAGNIYITDRGNATIRKVTPAGVVTTLAGVAGSSGSADGTGSAARFNAPVDVDLDASGNLFVVDGHNFTIRRITPAGAVTTFAGTALQSGSADGTGSAARFLFPRGIMIDRTGALIYVADTDNQTFRRITFSGDVTTLAGTPGSEGSVDGLGSAARFKFPRGGDTDALGNLFIADRNNSTIRRISPTGAVTLFAGLNGNSGSTDGTGISARFNFPQDAVFDSVGNLFVTDTGNHTIRKITLAAVVTTLAGTAGSPGSTDGTGAAARFDNPIGIGVDGQDNLYVTDLSTNLLRKITPAGVVTTLAGSAPVSGSLDATGTASRFNFPAGVATDSAGNVYVSDRSNHLIRKITSAGVVTTLAGQAGVAGSADGTGTAAQFDQPAHLTVDSAGNVYVADRGNHTIRNITSAGAVSTLAGSAGNPGSADGTGSVARFNDPDGITVDGAGTLYVADRGNHTIRKITSAGVVTTLAGIATVPGSADGAGTAAQFNSPADVTVDAGGTVYVADSANYAIRKVTSGGVVSTFAGSAGVAGSADGTGTAARFGQGFGGEGPDGIALDSSGNLYVADTGNHTIRRITPTAVVTTVAGIAGSSGATDGFRSAARFDFPISVAVDPSGKVYIADQNNHAIRLGILGLSGDANGDGAVTVGDIFYLINFLFAGGPASIGPSDVNADGGITVGDIFYLINFLFAGGPTPL